MPYCETHYHAKRGSLCAGCSKPITGRCITAMFRKFHPEHFVCAFCLKQLNKGEKKINGETCELTPAVLLYFILFFWKENKFYFYNGVEVTPVSENGA
jgi:LIM domain